MAEDVGIEPNFMNFRDSGTTNIPILKVAGASGVEPELSVSKTALQSRYNIPQ